MAKKYRTIPAITLPEEDVTRIIDNSHDDAWYGTLPLMGAYTLCKYLEHKGEQVTVKNMSMLIQVSTYRVSKLMRGLIDIGLLHEVDDD